MKLQIRYLEKIRKGEIKDGLIQIITHNKITRIDSNQIAFMMALTKYINGEKWR